MPSPARLKYFTQSILRCLTASALLLCLTTASLYATQEVFLRLDSGGHTAIVRKLLVTAEGRVVTASDDKTIRIWNPSTGREERKILGQLGPGPEGMIYAIALSPDANTLAVGGYLIPEDVIRPHDFRTGGLLQILKGHEDVVHNLAFSPYERRLLAGRGARPNKVNIWNVRTGKLLTSYTGHENLTMAVAVSITRPCCCCSSSSRSISSRDSIRGR